MSQRQELAVFESYLETLGLDTATMQGLPEQTITLAGNFEVEVRADALHTLPELVVEGADSGDIPPDLRVVRTLGEGGMGLVRLANQVSLDREVAVKTIREGKGEAAAQSLLREAYMTGYLEHPNIIPIYTIGQTSDGAPLIVMKRVEGTSWQELVEGDRQDTHSNLVAHIEILIQVANAVRFAHSRRVVHRDIKLENVMIGHFDEVYLLDWGIAVTLSEDKPLLARRSDTRGVCGTPCYMAPEMATQRSEEVDELTDVYLLGATLHHVLTGSPRHQGQDVLRVLFAASQSQPFEYDQQVPAELAAIANKACHVDKEKRFSSVDAFREALDDFLLHRESIALGVSADEKKEKLIELVNAEELATREITNTYAECRFGYYQSLRMWPQNKRATRGLQGCLEVMANFYLRQENIDAARECIRELPEPRPELSDRADGLANKLQEKQKDLHRLKRLESNLDLSTASSARSLLMLIVGLLWTITSTLAAFRHGTPEMTDITERFYHMTSGVRNIGIIAVVIFFFRKPLFANEVNRRLVYLMVSTVIISAALRWSAWYLEASLVLARTGDALIFVGALIALGLLSDLRICIFASYFAIAGMIGVLWPGALLYAQALATGLTFGSFAWIWRPSQLGRIT